MNGSPGLPRPAAVRSSAPLPRAARVGAALALVPVGLAAAASNASTEVASRPNVVLIIADDLAIGDIGAFNGGRTRTPHIDRLIAGGLWFQRGYSGSPVCAPARAALHTGRYPHRTGVVSLTMATEPALTRLGRRESTIGDVFRAAGYATGLIGKWHLGMGAEWHPLRRGFQEFSGFIGARNSYFQYELEIRGETRAFRDHYLTDELSERAVDFVRRHADRPFFLELAHYAPHRPLEAPPEAVQRYRDRGDDPKTATVYAMVEIMDAGIGALVRTLDELRIRDRTLIVFVSDNGPDPLAAERFNHGLRGTKYQIYEGGIRVPFVMNWPGRIAAGESAGPVHFVDLLPTVADMTGIAPLPGLPLDGRSFAATVLSGSVAADAARPLFWQWNRGAPNYTHNAAMLDGTWKLVRPFVTQTGASPADSPARAVLYHLGTDPAENTDVAAQHPARYAAMQAALDDWSRAVESERRAVAAESGDPRPPQ